MDTPYHQENIETGAILVNKARSPSQYQDGNNMSYSEGEALKQLPEASSSPKFSGTGEYDQMELIDYIDRIFINVPSIPDYWMTARLNTAFKGNASIWVELKEKRTERLAEVAKKNNSFHDCGSTDLFANNCPKAKEKVYVIEKVPEEESPTEDSESDSMSDAIREKSDEDQEPIEEFIVEYQEETQIEIQDIQLEAGMPQDTENKTCVKTHKMHKHSSSHQLKEWHTHMGQPQI
ncbi:hypothetical protein O181_017069 [Austropuccinia psidii MF-1]|uniref:Uncharacterized protein n=1 Tax=Austropuccinia psidii MF-1 TaxID=1389203 RepID=A0A9Q3GSE9_9BASI|nr:hypothetical protein [Austropuccinia psidii MF-1]